MGIKRIVDTAFWTDGKVEEFTPEDKYFMLYLLTNPQTTQLGIYEISVKRAAYEMGYSIDAVRALIERFEKVHEMIVYSKDTNEIAIKNFLKHSIVKGGKPVEDCLEREMRLVRNRKLIALVFNHISKTKNLNKTVKDMINKYYIENGVVVEDDFDNEDDNVNENDNDNDVSYPVQGTYRENQLPYASIKDEILNDKGFGDKTCEWCGCKTTILHKHHYPIPKRMGGKQIVNICSNCHNEFHVLEGRVYGDRHSDVSKLPKPIKHKHGEYKNVLLSDDELEKLKKEFSDWKDRIERLSSYVASTGKSYKSHYATIRNWARKDKEQKAQRGTVSANGIRIDDSLNDLDGLF